MSNSTNDGGPAFPLVETCAADSVTVGMSLRDYFAAKALQGICAHENTWGESKAGIAAMAYSLADEMLKARAA